MTLSVTNLGIDGLDQVEQIGTGGSSRVYKARQVDLDRVVAVKVLNLSNDKDVAKRFDRERKAMGRLSLHEGIVPVYSTGVTSHGEPYLVMPYYANGSLQDQLDTGTLEWQTAVSFIDVAAETIAAAHDAGVVHLDLKPANILLTNKGAPRIADFGIAKLSGAASGATTGGAAFTPAYSAPETFLEGQIGPASDVYGLGATLWALLVGHPPFLAPGDDSNLMAVIGRVVNNPVGDLQNLAPQPIADVVYRAMAKNAEDRYQTAREFSVALKEAARSSVDAAAATVPAQNGSSLFPDVPSAQTQSGPSGAASPALQTHAMAGAADLSGSNGPADVATSAGATGVWDPAVTQPAPSDRNTTAFYAAPSAATTGAVPSAQEQPARSLLLDTAQPASVPLGVPSDTPAPLLDLDRLRLGPILLAGVAAALIFGFVIFSLLSGDDPSDETLATDPAGPETSEPLDGLGNPDGSLPSSEGGDQGDGVIVTTPTTDEVTSTTEDDDAATTSTTESTTTTEDDAATTSTSESTTTTEDDGGTTSTTEETTPTTDATSSTTEETTPTTDATSSTTEETTPTTEGTTSTTETTVPVGEPDLTAQRGDDNSVSLSWKKGSGPAPDGYRVRRGLTVLADELDATSLVDAGLSPGTYSYTVTPVVDGDEVTGSRSNTVTVSVGAPEITKFTAVFVNGELEVSLAANQPVTYRLGLLDLSEDPDTHSPKSASTPVETDTVTFSGVDDTRRYQINLTNVTNDVGQKASRRTLRCVDGVCS